MGAVVDKIKKKPLAVTDRCDDHSPFSHAGVGTDLDREPEHPLPKGERDLVIQHCGYQSLLCLIECLSDHKKHTVFYIRARNF